MKSFIDHQHLPIKKTAKIHTKGGKRNSVAKADRYFSSLSEDQVGQLYQIYKYDFQMFGYEYESYLQLASLNTNKKKNEFDLALEKVREEEKHQTKKKKQKQGKQKKTNNRRGQAGGMKKRKPFKLHKWRSIYVLNTLRNKTSLILATRIVFIIILMYYYYNALSWSSGRMLLFFFILILKEINRK